MTQRRPVLGYFYTIAEAQQAIQLLLARGFTDENLELSMPTGSSRSSADERLLSPTKSDSSGRFLSSLFDSRAEVPSQNGILVTVQTQSVAEARQVADLLVKAGAAEEDNVFT